MYILMYVDTSRQTANEQLRVTNLILAHLFI
jgi:hypothetical protein